MKNVQVYLFWFLNINKYSLSEAGPGRSVEYKDTLGENTESAFFFQILMQMAFPQTRALGVKQLCLRRIPV